MNNHSRVLNSLINSVVILTALLGLLVITGSIAEGHALML